MRDVINCLDCGDCAWHPDLVSECPHCAEMAGRKALNIGCPWHEDGPDPFCWTRQTGHCSCCHEPFLPGDTAWQFLPIASKQNGWGPVWCDKCLSPQGKTSGEWEEFRIEAR